MKIHVLMCRVGQSAVIEPIENDLASMQAAVGGYIEAMGLSHPLFVICNEEGKLKGLRPNRVVRGETIVGDFFVCRAEGAEFVGLHVQDLAKIATFIEVE